MATPTGEWVQDTHGAGHPNQGEPYYIFMLRKSGGNMVQLYIPHSGHRHFSATNSLATLVNAVLSCPELLQAVEQDSPDTTDGWSGTFNSNGVRFLCRQANDVGRCIMLFHSESPDAYQQHNRQRTQDRYNQPPRRGQAM
jgi:hypothetical protein